MKSLKVICQSPRTSIDKTYTYSQYYRGGKDHEGRRCDDGCNHWSGAESLEWYTGQFLRDTMHGYGDYRWRYRGPDGDFVTYEGNFFANSIHGYGTMSYPDGRVFNGLYYRNIRWGPGVESHASLNEDVGLWRGTQLVRLSWRPLAPDVAFDMTSTSEGRAFIQTHRVLLSSNVKTIGETNSAVTLLKQYGARSAVAEDKWTNLYTKSCTDLESQLCNVDDFNRCYYYDGKITTLEEQANSIIKDSALDTGYQGNNDKNVKMEVFYAWNNDAMIIQMMQHCYTHEYQRVNFGIELTRILCGPRSFFKSAGKHELDCRTLLMASYLGYIVNVAQFVNKREVNPNISDNQGNTALMYAVCGNQFDTVHFLVEAGANVNSFNDSCCTALNLALMKYVCTEKNIPAACMVEALLPPSIIPSPPPKEEEILEWNITRDLKVLNQAAGITRTPSKIAKSPNTKRIKSSTSAKDLSSPKKIIEGQLQKPEFQENESLESFNEEQKLYFNINNEYFIRVNDLFDKTEPSGVNTVGYLFDIPNMMRELEANEDDLKKFLEKGPKKVISKTLKDILKPSKDMMWKSSDDKADYTSKDSADQLKQDALSHTLLTIGQLLSDGADPRLVRCPQPAMFFAILSGCSELVRELVKYGADIDEVYPQTFNYTALDVAISLSFTFENVEVIRALLDCGAHANHRLAYFDSVKNDIDFDVPGPTLLHAVLAKKVDNETEEDMRREVVHSLLEHKCDPILQFKGRSAFDISMSKSIDIYDIFIKSSNTDLNAVINSLNQTILVKMFTEPFFSTLSSNERLQTLSNLLLFGADPLVKCRNEDETYENLFVLARKIYKEMNTPNTKSSGTVNKAEAKGKKPEKTKKDDKLLTKSVGKVVTGLTEDYKQAIDLVTECARLLHIRWLQSKLVKELLKIVYKYKHRHWNMILKQQENKKCTGLWVTAIRCLEVWDILKTAKYKYCNDTHILKYTLYIVHFCNSRFSDKTRVSRYMTAQEKGSVESEVDDILKEYKASTALSLEMVPLKRPYVTPELEIKADVKFNVCFECALPFAEQNISCQYCKLVSFCSEECLKTNLNRINCHPCSELIKKNVFLI